MVGFLRPDGRRSPMEWLWPALGGFRRLAPVEWRWFFGFDEMMRLFEPCCWNGSEAGLPPLMA
jgi:hypothetical protein